MHGAAVCQMSTGPQTILLVDDDKHLVVGASAVLRRAGFDVVTAHSGADGYQKAREVRPDLILCDVMMPPPDGFELRRRLSWASETAEIPFVFLTARGSKSEQISGIADGADDYIVKPFERDELVARIRAVLRRHEQGRVSGLRQGSIQIERLMDLSPDVILLVDGAGAIRLANQRARLVLGGRYDAHLIERRVTEFVAPDHAEQCMTCFADVLASDSCSRMVETEFLTADGTRVPMEASLGHFEWQDGIGVQVTLRDISERKRAERDLRRAHEELARAYDATLEGWAMALELRDRETAGHSARVSTTTVRLARALGVPKDEMVHYFRGAVLHDIGKMGVLDAVLQKPGPLTADERAVMQRHPVYAREMLAPIAYLAPALDIPTYHHERWDGSGYPRGLAGEAIPLAARVFAAVDVWDALRSDRPYRTPMSIRDAQQYLRDQRGRHFDPRVVDTFLSLPLD